MALISVITPLYNSEAYIAETIKSVQMQTFTDYEHIIVDDCSSDRSVDICLEFQKRDKRIKIIKLVANAGPAAARNIAIENATGRFIAFIDSDDLWSSEFKLEKQLKYMLETDVAYTYHAYEAVFEAGGRKIIRGPRAADWRILHCRRGFGFCLTSMIDLEKGAFRFNAQRDLLAEDFLAFADYLRPGLCGRRVEGVTAVYRVRGGSRSGSKLRAIRDVWRIYRNCENIPLVQAMLFWLCYVFDAARLMYLLPDGKP